MQPDLQPSISAGLDSTVNRQPAHKDGSFQKFKRLHPSYKALTIIVSGLAGLFLILPGIMAFRVLVRKLPKMKKIHINSDIPEDNLAKKLNAAFTDTFPKTENLFMPPTIPSIIKNSHQANSQTLSNDLFPSEVNSNKKLIISESICTNQSDFQMSSDIPVPFSNNSSFKSLTFIEKRKIVYLAREIFNEGLKLHTQGKLEEAFNKFEESAKLGDMDALYEVGRCYESGIGTPLNTLLAISSYEALAALEKTNFKIEHTDARLRLFNIYKGQKNYSKALVHLEKLDKNPCLSSFKYYWTGRFLEEGMGCEKDLQKANENYDKMRSEIGVRFLPVSTGKPLEEEEKQKLLVDLKDKGYARFAFPIALRGDKEFWVKALEIPIPRQESFNIARLLDPSLLDDEQFVKKILNNQPGFYCYISVRLQRQRNIIIHLLKAVSAVEEHEDNKTLAYMDLHKDLVKVFGDWNYCAFESKWIFNDSGLIFAMAAVMQKYALEREEEGDRHAVIESMHSMTFTPSPELMKNPQFLSDLDGYFPGWKEHLLAVNGP